MVFAIPSIIPFAKVLCIVAFSAMTCIGSTKGQIFPDTLQVENREFVLNGKGVRTKLGLTIYWGGLFLSHKSTNAQEIIETKKAMAVRMHMISGLVTAERLEKSIRQGFHNAVDSPSEQLNQQIESFIKILSEDVQKNDIYDLVYMPDKGVVVYKNGVLLSITEGLEFKKALFAIWLGKKPVQMKLKNKMLGLQ